VVDGAIFVTPVAANRHQPGYRNLSAYQRAVISIALPLRFEAAAAVRCTSHDNRNQTLQFPSIQRLRESYVGYPTLTPLDGQIQLFRM
jgi:hypothetical protein